MLITNGKLITWEQPNQVLEGQAIAIEGDTILEIGLQADLLTRYPERKQLDARGQFVMPGNLCAHTHFYGAFARGMAIPGSPPKDFPEILGKLWWPLDRALDYEDIRYSALVMLIEAIRHGTTTLVDHHASPSAIDGALDVIAEAVELAGLRSVLCYEVTDRNGFGGAKAGIAENVRFIKKHAGRNPPPNHMLGAVKHGAMLGAMFGLHASLTLSDQTLDACRAALPAGCGFHLHVAEGEADQVDSLAKSGLRVVERLQRHGILSPACLAAHAVHVNSSEIELLAGTGTWVSHQPRSNMNNGVGVAGVEDFLRAGIPVGIGTDGFTSTMWTEWKTAYLLQKAWHTDPRRMSALDIIQMGVYNNARLVEQFLPGTKLGVLQSGACADLIFVDYPPFTPLTAGNLPWHLLFGFDEGMVTTTIVAGKVLMHDRQLARLDEEAIHAKARELSRGVWKRYMQNT